MTDPDAGFGVFAALLHRSTAPDTLARFNVDCSRASPSAACSHGERTTKQGSLVGRTRVARGSAALLFLGVLGGSAQAQAQESSAPDAARHDPRPPVAGREALERARAAWDKGDYDVAEPLYAEAIETGGMAPRDILDAYVRLGSARAVLGKKAASLAAFKAAAILDLRFAVPTEAGKRAMAIADQARRQEASLGPLTFHADIPDQVPPGGPASVDVTLDAAHAALPGAKITLDASDLGHGGSHGESTRSARATHFDLPASLLLPSTTLRVRVDWVDAHANRLASADEQVHVQSQATSDILSPLSGRTGEGGGHAHDSGDGKHGGFWHTAWPYIIGGAALAAGGAAIYFATRSGDDVNVTGVRVLTH